MRTYLGVDQSLRKTGVVVLSETGTIVLRHLIQPASLRGAARLAYIRDALRDVISEHRPASAALEGYSYDSTGKVFELGEAGGVVKLCFFDAQIPSYVVSPAALKKFVADNHQATKEQMLRKTLDKWGVDFQKEDDLCDAHGLSRIVRSVEKKDCVRRNELEVVHDLTTPVELPTPTRKTARSKVRVSV